MLQKARSKLPTWGQTKDKSKQGFDKVWGWADKLGAPVNRLSNRIGSEAFWPTTLDLESDKAARILRSFCSEFHAQSPQLSQPHPVADNCDPQRMASTPKNKHRPTRQAPRRNKKCSRRSRKR